MPIIQADFYRRPLKDSTGQPLWELLLCDESGNFRFNAFCPQSQATVDWVKERFLEAFKSVQPETIKVFRPQSLSIIKSAAEKLNIPVEGSRKTQILKEWLKERWSSSYLSERSTGEIYEPLEIEKLPPIPLPEGLWGEVWRFAAIEAGEIVERFRDFPIPVVEMPENLWPLNLGIASTIQVPGVVINGGKKAMRLTRALAEKTPVALSYIPGNPDGLILEAGLNERWIIATFEDQEVAAAGKVYEQRKLLSKGLHFLLIQPDDSGMTYSGFWLLREE
ncbi:MAG: Tab2/Atab2 family RNA-binding protein [Oscillatoriaceae bacterium SKYG93]|nr:Tab2/Atab2 family RNA-binding protein [Oscillatoriaceae bacterium SKYG93]MDW8452472.1 Tab2/Atab2 family RNA-binding protein [Oscillatoriaceae cyanobacterium SKYGB_i_bin93]